MPLLLHSCCCSASAGPVAGNGWALLILSREGYCSPCQRLLTLPLREDGRLSHSLFCSSAELLHSCPRQQPHRQNGFPHGKSLQCRAEHCAPPNLPVLQVVHSFSKLKKRSCSPDFCTASMPQHWASTEHLPGCSVTVSASLNPSAGVDVETQIPGCSSTQAGQQQHSSIENTKHPLNRKHRYLKDIFLPWKHLLCCALLNYVCKHRPPKFGNTVLAISCGSAVCITIPAAPSCTLPGRINWCLHSTLKMKVLSDC